MMSIKQFVKDWTLPVAIAVGTIVYLTFYFVPQLDAAGETLGAVVDTIFPMMVFCTLFSTFCRIDFHQMKPHRWHVGVLLAQVLLVALNVWIIFCVEASFEQKILWESVLTCIIGPAATAAPVVGDGADCPAGSRLIYAALCQACLCLDCVHPRPLFLSLGRAAQRYLWRYCAEYRA